jgi:hypothetical protein
MSRSAEQEQRLRRYRDRHARSHDQQTGFFDRHLSRDSRQWICAQAVGDVLEVAIGTGLNLAQGVEWSPTMLDLARHRAEQLHRTVDLRLATRRRWISPTAASTPSCAPFSLCAIPDDRKALKEMAPRRPAAADHVEATRWDACAAQRLLNLVTIPVGGEHFRRRPLAHVAAMGPCRRPYRLDQRRARAARRTSACRCADGAGSHRGYCDGCLFRQGCAMGGPRQRPARYYRAMVDLHVSTGAV